MDAILFLKYNMSLLALGPTQLGHFLHDIRLPPKLCYSTSNLHSSITALLTWSKLTESTCPNPCSHLQVLYLVAKWSTFTLEVFLLLFRRLMCLPTYLFTYLVIKQL